MSDLAKAVLPLIRTRAELYRWGAANAHGRQMHKAVDALERSAATEDPVVVLTVTQKAIASAVAVIARADDSSGIIGDACRRLLALHPRVAARAGMPARRLVDWMIDFQFHSKIDFFTLDPVAYAPALGQAGLVAYRDRLAQIAAGLGPRPKPGQRTNSHEWLVLEHNEQRLAVLDRDAEAIIATHARDGRVAAWLHDTAKALAEADHIDLAIDWAKRATDHEPAHQAHDAGDYWCTLLAEHRPDELVPARRLMFDRWPSATTAAALLHAAGTAWPDHRDHVADTLAAHPRRPPLRPVHPRRHRLRLGPRPPARPARQRHLGCLVKAYEKIDPLAVLPILPASSTPTSPSPARAATRPQPAA